jgi:hypothetical protein
MTRSGKSIAISLSTLLAMNASGETGNLKGQRIHSDGQKNLFDKRLSTLSIRIGLGAVNPMDQFGCGSSRQSCRLRSTNRLYSLKNLRDTFSPAFAGNQDTGVKNYSHAGGVHGLRLAMISSRSAAKSGSIRGS